MLVGALLAVVTVRSLRARSNLLRFVAVGLATLALVVLAWLTHAAAIQATWLYPWGLLLAAASTAAAIVGVVQTGWIASVLSVAPLTYLGRISYGVYLVHWPVFLWLTPERTGLDGPVLLLVRVGCTVVVAAVSFRFLERPVRLGELITTHAARRLVPVGAACLVVAAVLTTDGVPPRPDYLTVREEVPVEVIEAPADPAADPDAPGTADTSAPTDAASVGPSPETSAPQGPIPAPVPAETAPVRAQRVLFVGDSIAKSLEGALGDTWCPSGSRSQGRLRRVAVS